MALADAGGPRRFQGFEHVVLCIRAGCSPLGEWIQRRTAAVLGTAWGAVWDGGFGFEFSRLCPGRQRYNALARKLTKPLMMCGFVPINGLLIFLRLG
ncbi:hypothetical protein IMCC21224_1610 [Puniceibacterium sp. IMCC21224]|nr:hypothetical protein IMCC21224_1610 [Puniceibacterium sp. IMCC21224]